MVIGFKPIFQIKNAFAFFAWFVYFVVIIIGFILSILSILVTSNYPSMRRTKSFIL
jgi:hypothetical protein